MAEYRDKYGTGASNPRVEGADAIAAERSGVSWAAIVAGAVGAASLSLILLLLGTGLGLSSISPWTDRGASATALGVTAILWITFTQLAASGIGGYLAGRLRTKWVGVQTTEVYFRDTAHGFLAWAVATLLTAALLTTTIASILGTGVQAGAGILGGATAAAGAAGAGAVASSGSSSGAGFIDGAHGLLCRFPVSQRSWCGFAHDIRADRRQPDRRTDRRSHPHLPQQSSYGRTFARGFQVRGPGCRPTDRVESAGSRKASERYVRTVAGNAERGPGQGQGRSRCRSQDIRVHLLVAVHIPLDRSLRRQLCSDLRRPSARSLTFVRRSSMPAILLWLLGVPIPIIILIALLF